MNQALHIRPVSLRKASTVPAGWGAQEQPVDRRCLLPKEELLSLRMVLHQQVPESRHVQGLRHRQATVLGILRRAVHGEARAWMRRQPRARDRTYPTFLAKMSRRLAHVLRSLTCPA
jgi:hypothetical protein